MEEHRGWVRAWREDVLVPLFAGTAAEPLVQSFHEKLDPTLSPPSSPEPSPPGSPTLPFPGLPALSTSADTAATASTSSRSASVSSLSFGQPGYRRSMSVSSTGGQSARSVSVTRTGVNNSKNWAGREVKMSKRAIGGAKPKPRQASCESFAVAVLGRELSWSMQCLPLLRRSLRPDRSSALNRRCWSCPPLSKSRLPVAGWSPQARTR